MNRFLRVIILSLLLSISLLATNEKVSLQLQWLHQFQFAGFYIAKERGFYDEVGLDVSIKELNRSTDVLGDVVDQKSEYGTLPSSLLLDRANGAPIVALGALYQHSPSILLCTNPTIKTLQDLKNKRIMVTENEANSVSIMAMLLSKGISLDDIKIQKHSFKLEDLIKGKTDAMASYLSNEPFFLKQANIPYKIFNPKDYGFDFYGDIIFTSEYQLQQYPKRTKAFYDASIKGWYWAFEHIEETAQIIFNKYNSQNKSLESFIYEGKILKKFALDKNKKIGFLSMKQINTIADFYRLSSFLNKPYDFTPYIDPKGYNKQQLRLGVLSKRGNERTLQRWQPLANYLNRVLEHYHVTIYPVEFDDLQESIQTKKIDFLLANTMNYVQLKNKYGISRIATLKNMDINNTKAYNYFGGVIFTKKDSKIKDIDMIRGDKLAAVNENSFGGWIIPYELLYDNGIEKKDIDLKFYNTHDAVVYAVLNSKAEVGVVRSDTLERMVMEKKIDLDEFKIINLQKYDNFPYLVSTKLYPEWPFSKLQHVSDKMAAEVMVALISMPQDSQEAIEAEIGGWTAPLDYSSVYTLLKKLNLPPYDGFDFKLIDIFQKYAIWIYTFLFFMFLGFLQYLHVKRLNTQLDKKVDERTQELFMANQKLKELAHKDSLTGIYNRGYFMTLAEQFFSITKRNATPFQMLSLDIDDFKNVNDTYGHNVGDVVLKMFCSKISAMLRTSDIFGRIGGEEFCICLQNTTHDGAIVFAEKILQEIRQLSYEDENKNIIKFTVSIGIAEFKEQETLEELLHASDKALYKAKNRGRDCVVSN